MHRPFLGTKLGFFVAVSFRESLLAVWSVGVTSLFFFLGYIVASFSFLAFSSFQVCYYKIIELAIDVVKAVGMNHQCWRWVSQFCRKNQMF